jgi:cysteine desulfurase
VIYLDANATVPLHPAARAAWLDVTDRRWHNPSGLYAAGTAARDLLEDRRERLATILDCDPQRVVFTAGATAAMNAIARHLGQSLTDGRRALVSGGEHPCVAESFELALPGRVETLLGDASGVVRLDLLESRLASDRPGVVSIMAASNEVGVIQPWSEAAALCRSHGVAFHTDAAQWLGKLPARGLGMCDWVTGSGHKFGGPKGVGFLVVPEGDRRFRGDSGGPQERGRHAGTEDVAAVAALLAALEACEAEPPEDRLARAAARDAAEARFHELLPQGVVVGRDAPRLWNTLAVVVPGSDGKKLVARLAAAGIAVSTGSACSAGAGSTARILDAIGAAALGLDAADLRGLVRLSAGWETTAADWIAAVEALATAAGPTATLPRITL